MKIILTSLLLLTFCTAHSQTDTTKNITTDSAIYFNPEIPSMYPGGQIGWTRYLLINLRYPKNAVKKNIQGTVIIQFIVDSTGFAHNYIVVSGPEELSDEAMRLVKKAGLWFAALNHGKKVNSWKTQSINFKLE